jgi:hypothetical protein
MISGLLIALLGLWGALIPFVGPYFDYSFGVNATWHYTTDRLVLSVLPGAAALVGGVLILFAASRLAGVVGGWLAVLAGAWFAIGPAFSRIWEKGAGPIGAPLFGHTRQALELVGSFYGLGVLVAVLAAFAVGRFASRPALTSVEAEPMPTTQSPAPLPPRRARLRSWRRRAGAPMSSGYAGTTRSSSETRPPSETGPPSEM